MQCFICASGCVITHSFQVQVGIDSISQGIYRLINKARNLPPPYRGPALFPAQGAAFYFTKRAPLPLLN